MSNQFLVLTLVKPKSAVPFGCSGNVSVALGFVCSIPSEKQVCCYAKCQISSLIGHLSQQVLPITCKAYPADKAQSLAFLFREDVPLIFLQLITCFLVCKEGYVQ